MDDEQAFKALELFGNPTEGEVRLPSRPESAATARRLTSCVVLRQWALSPQTAEYAVLLVSELVGNAVRHTGARVFGLRMVRRRGWIRIEVRDPSRGLPCLMPVREMDISGRGLFLVDKLSDRWGWICCRAARPPGSRCGSPTADPRCGPPAADPVADTCRTHRSPRSAVVRRCGGFCGGRERWGGFTAVRDDLGPGQWGSWLRLWQTGDLGAKDAFRVIL